MLVAFHPWPRKWRSCRFPQSYRMQLLEAFSAFDTYLDQLLQLLTPIIGRLPALLEPWVRQAARLQEKWSQFFSGEFAGVNSSSSVAPWFVTTARL